MHELRGTICSHPPLIVAETPSLYDVTWLDGHSSTFRPDGPPVASPDQPRFATN
jgi:hypothetical protein